MTNNPLVEALRPAVLAALKRWSELPDDERNGERPYIMGWNDGYEHALASSAPATGEREQIVAFLRDADKSEHPSDLADAIARGDHRTQSGEMEGGEHD